MISRWVLVVALALLMAHALTIANYGYFGDELYFIDCARHLAWGYVDLPPFAAVLCRLAAPLAYSLWAIRILPVLAACGTVILAALIAREFGGKRFAQTLTAVCVALAPTNLLYASFLSTSSFEPFTWSLTVLLVLRLRRTNDPRTFAAIGAVCAAALYMKYSIVLCVLALLVGLILSGNAKQLANRWFFSAIAACVLLALPNLLWQTAHGLPFLDVVKTDALDRHPLGNGVAIESSNLFLNAALFAVMQVLYLNPALAFVWIWGLVWLARAPQARPFRFVGIAYAVLFVLMVVGNARGYYMSAFYSTLFAAGSTAIEAARMPRGVRRGALVLAAIGGLVFAPLAIPVLPLDTLIAYTAAMGLSKPSPPDGKPHLIQPLYAEEIGWDSMTQAVAAVYRGLPAKTRASTAIFTDGYSYAGALNFYGPRYGLPRVLSANNNYGLWGYDGYDGSRMIAIGATDYALYTRLYRSVQQVAVYRNTYRWMVEGPLPIYLCTGPRMSLAQMWPLLRKYGL